MFTSLVHRPQDAVFGWVITVSLVAVGLFCLDAFFPLVALLGGSILWAIAWVRVFGKALLSSPTLSRSDAKFLLLIIVIGLVFRIGPYPCVVGGQDQGVYVNMSYSYEREHGAFHIDPVRSQLEDHQLLEAYDRANLRRSDKENPKTGVFLPGVYVKDLAVSEYVFQFYHLHSLWMSIFGSVLGGLNRLYSLTFFSILSLCAFYLLTLELFENRILALVAACLLSLNPLHAFFSKFPVTEVGALAFSTSGFYYLIRFHKRARKGDHDWRDLALSTFLMGCMFFTRISGFMYMPTIWLILVVVVLYEDDRRIRSCLVSFCAAVGFLYMASVVYGLHFSSPYAREIYRLSFSGLFGPSWPLMILLGASLMAILTAAGWILAWNRVWNRGMRTFLEMGRGILPWAFFVVGLLGLVRVWQLAMGVGEFSHWMIPHWKLYGIGIGSVLRSSLVVAGSYVSPPLVALAVAGLFCRRKTPYLALVLAFLFQFVVYIAFFQWLIAYQYYYARYLLSEVVPFSILIAMAGLFLFWSNRIGKKIALVLVPAAAFYFLYFTAPQWLGKEADGAYTALEELTREVDADDLIFMKRDSFKQQDQIRTPLIYVFDRRVVVFEDVTTVQRYVEARGKAGWPFKEYFVLSTREIDSPMFELVAETIYREGHFEKAAIIPRRFSNEYEFPLFLFRLREGEFGREELEQQLVELALLKEGFHSDGTWTKAGGGTLSGFRVDLADKRFIILETHGLNPFKHDPEMLGLWISIGEIELPPHHQEGFRYFFEIPAELTEIKSLTIHSNTFVPKELGVNDDERRLGIDFKSIDFE